MKRNLKTVKRYDENTKALAVAMYYDGATSAQVAEAYGMTASYVRGLLFHKKGSDVVTLEAVTSLPETPVLPVLNGLAETASDAETPRFKIGEMDAVIYVTTATACAALATSFGGLWLWAVPISIVYVLILFHAMRLAADQTVQKTASNAAGVVIVFELLAACAHTYVFNLVLWANYKALPFEIVWRPYSYQDPEFGFWSAGGWIPFAIAATLGVLTSGSAVYALITKIQITRERARGASHKQISTACPL